mgnify:FL=1
MGQKDEVTKLKANSRYFVELQIEDLVKSYLHWNEGLNKRTYPSDVLPSVIHGVDSGLVTIR